MGTDKRLHTSILMMLENLRLTECRGEEATGTGIVVQIPLYKMDDLQHRFSPTMIGEINNSGSLTTKISVSIKGTFHPNVIFHL